MQVVKKSYSNAADAPREERFAETIELIQGAIEDGVTPGLVLLVARNNSVLFCGSYGVRHTKSEREHESNRLSTETVYDVASVSAAVVTATLAMKLFETGKFKLEDRAARFIQGFGVHGKSDVTIGQLLNHTSGLAAWAPYYEELARAHSGARLGVLTSRGAKEYVLNSIIRGPLKHDPNTRQIYSDLGLILLGHLVETFTGLTLDKAAQRHIIQPLGLKSTSYIDLSMIKRRGIHPVTDLIAPTEECPWRKRILCGEVHDDNAWAMGGIAGNSGLFSTALDLHRFAAEMMACYRGTGSLLRQDTVERFWNPPEMSGREGWKLGWDSPSSENGMDDSGLSKHAVGICGFTGCSMWIEPDKGINVILMTNRIHPSRSNKKITSFRPRLHKAVLQALGAL